MIPRQRSRRKFTEGTPSKQGRRTPFHLSAYVHPLLASDLCSSIRVLFVESYSLLHLSSLRSHSFLPSFVAPGSCRLALSRRAQLSR